MQASTERVRKSDGNILWLVRIPFPQPDAILTELDPYASTHFIVACKA